MWNAAPILTDLLKIETAIALKRALARSLDADDASEDVAVEKVTKPTPRPKVEAPSDDIDLDSEEVHNKVVTGEIQGPEGESDGFAELQRGSPEVTKSVEATPTPVAAPKVTTSPSEVQAKAAEKFKTNKFSTRFNGLVKSSAA